MPVFSTAYKMKERLHIMTIGEKLVKLRKEQNLTQEQFAEVLQVSRQSVSKCELNTAYPDTEKLHSVGKFVLR